MLLLYIHIDYEPIQYLLPISGTLENVPFNPGSLTPPPLCVVYSPINLTEFEFILKTGGFVVSVFNNAYSVRQLHPLYIIQIVPSGNNFQLQQLQSNCRAVTQWENTLSRTYRISFDMESKLNTNLTKFCFRKRASSFIMYYSIHFSINWFIIYWRFCYN